MRIAYISFEFPPDTAVGGIATYVYQVSLMMKNRGHDVEVFTASPTRTISENFEGLLVHRIQTSDRDSFRKEILSIFKQRHLRHNFDLLESPEFSGDGYEIKKEFPLLPLVVKLHTPASFIRQLDNHYTNKITSTYTKLKYIAGGIVKGEKRKLYWKNKNWAKKEEDIDYLITALADQIHTPSISLGDIVSEKWNIERKKIYNVPYPFIPNENFLQIPIGAQKKTITYIGRLEIRKGLIALTEAMPAIFEAVSEANFNFVGKPVHSIIPGLNMREYIETKLRKYKSRIHFLNVGFSEIPGVLQETNVCVFPSIWENFPNVCLEAMSAGRAIVASNRGGMKDMLEKPKCGLLVDPLNSKEIADAVIELLQNNELNKNLGMAARQKVFNEYNSYKIGSLMETCYGQLSRTANLNALH